MRDRSKNRKPLQKGRNLSIEAIQAVQALKRVANKNDDSAVEQVFDSKVRRLIKSDMIAVLRELLRQNQCLLALKVRATHILILFSGLVIQFVKPLSLISSFTML